MQRYRADLQRKGFHPDAAQLSAVERLQQLYQQLLQSAPPPSFFDKLLKRGPIQVLVRGVYLWGGVGRGKTHLMDGFYESLPITAKRRLHFHRFMVDLHQELTTLPKTPDPLPIVAKRLALEVRVLCLDEFHVQDIGDAMLLSGFLAALFDNGVTLVTTSNIPPDELYKSGLQRERFLPAIELIKKHTHELHLDNGKDYRLALLVKEGTYHVSVGTEAIVLLNKQYQSLAPGLGVRSARLNINNREICALAMADDVVWFDFYSLCATPRSAADYLEIARQFHTVLVGEVPVMDESKDDIAQRFVHLIDALYDHGVKLILCAQVLPQALYQGQRHTFSFQRTVSRLQEMASERYLALSHRI